MVVSPLASGSAPHVPVSVLYGVDRLANRGFIDVSLVTSMPIPAPACQSGNALLHPPHHGCQATEATLTADAVLNVMPLAPEARDTARTVWRRSEALRATLSRIVDRVRETLALDGCTVLASDDGPHAIALASAGPVTLAIPTIDPALLRSLTATGARGSLNDEPTQITVPVSDAATAFHASAIADGKRGTVTLLASCAADRRLAATDHDLIQLAARLAGIAIDQARAGRLVSAEWHWLEGVLALDGEATVARDAAGRIVHINDAARKILEIDRDATIIDLDESLLVHRLDLRDQWGQRVTPEMLPHHQVRAGLPATDLVVSGRSSAAEPRRWMLLHAHGVADGRGMPALVCTALRDFSVIQRHDAAQRLRANVARLLHERPLRIETIEREIAAFIDGRCAIALRASTAHPADEGEAARELRRLGGHPHVAAQASNARGEHAPAVSRVAVVPIVGDGVPYGQLVCRRERGQPCFDTEELSLLTELAGQIGLAVAVSHLHESLAAGERAIVDISRRLQAAEETERRRMALSIHDGLAQVAASVCQQLEILAHRFAPSCEDESTELDRARSLAQRTVREARMLIAGLRPVTLDEQGLGAAVLEEVQRLRADGWGVRYIDGVSGSRYPAEVELDLYRVAQEALTNIRKHAGMVPVEVTLEQTDGALHLEVRDAGAGFDDTAERGTSSEHVGLGGMRERVEGHGGTFVIESGTGMGTRVIATVPI